MKKSYVVLFAAFLLLISMSGCSWQIPEKVSVKTNAEYNFSVGKIEKDFKDVFSITSMLSSMDVKNARIYDYFPKEENEKLQQYFVRIPLFEIPVNFRQYFNNSGVAEQLEGMSFEQEVTIPSVSIDEVSYLRAGFISSAIATALIFTGTTGGNPDFTLSFSTVNFSSGTLTITCPGISDGSTVTLRSGSSSFTGYFSSGAAEINIASLSLKKNDVTLSFSGLAGLPYVGVFSSDSTIKRAEGLTSATPIPASVDSVVDLSSGSSFKYCEVESGSLTTNLKVPENWSGISMSYGLSATGGMNFTVPSSDSAEKTIDLAGKTISSGTTDFAVSVNLSFNNATYVNSSLEFTMKSNVTSYKKIAIALSDVTTSFSKTEAMADAMLDSVKSLTLSSSGLKATYTNTFPAGNDITIKAKSGFLGLDSSGVLASATESGNLDILTSSASKVIKISKNPVAADEYNSWDFDVSVLFPGATDSDSSSFEISNVTSGATYKLAIKLSPEINWTEIVIASDDFATSSTASLGINLGSMFNSFKDSFGGDFINNVKIESLPMYIYCNKPEMASGQNDPFENAKFVSTVSIYGATANEDGSLTKVKDSDGNDNEIKIFNDEKIGFSNVPNVEIKDNIVVTDISTLKYSGYKDISSIMSFTDSDSDLYLDYTVSFSNSSTGDIAITPAMLNATSSASGTLGIVAVIILPLKFKVVNGGVSIDLMNLIGKSTDSDLFGRTEATTGTSVSQYVSAINSASINYTADKLLFYSDPDISIDVKFKDTTIDEKYGVASGSISVDANSLNQMFDTYPLVPEISLNIADDSSFTISRYTAISLGISLQLKTDGTIVLFGGN